jgi:LysM repeat protein
LLLPAGCSAPAFDLGRPNGARVVHDPAVPGAQANGANSGFAAERGSLPVGRALGRSVTEEKALYHEVRAGETLSHIAAAYGTSVARLVAANGFDNPDGLSPGQLVYIPPKR